MPTQSTMGTNRGAYKHDDRQGTNYWQRELASGPAGPTAGGMKEDWHRPQHTPRYRDEYGDGEQTRDL